MSNAESIEFMGEFGSVEDALIAMPQVDVMLMDIGLPGISGIEAIAKVKEKFPETQLIMLTVFNDDKHISRAIMAGASGYLLKNTPYPQILKRLCKPMKEECRFRRAFPSVSFDCISNTHRPKIQT